MFHPILTISRECGSGGHSIGQAVAKALSIPLYDGEFIDLMVARTQLSPEYLASQEELFAPPFGMGLVSGALASGRSLPDEVHQAQVDLIQDLATQGPCVMVGRAADYVLRHRPHTLHVFIHAPATFKLNRILHEEQYRRLHHPDTLRMNDSQRQAYLEAIVTKRDKNRSRYYQYYTGRTWGDPHHYDLCINTGHWGIEGATRLLIHSYQQLCAEAQAALQAEEDD